MKKNEEKNGKINGKKWKMKNGKLKRETDEHRDIGRSNR